MRIAIVGSGISGLVVAHLLHRDHDITVFEASDWIGGHTHTVDVETNDGRFAVDTGFIVFNPPRYPGFVRLLDQLGVASRETRMSFSVRCDRSGLEYGATSLAALFAQKRNLVRPQMWRMLSDIARFNRLSRELLERRDDFTSLGTYLTENRFSEAFIDQFLLPMGAAIWSTDPSRMFDFPAATFAHFFNNHGFLEPFRRRPWRTVIGGSARYVEALVAPFHDRVRLSTPVQTIARFGSRVEIKTRGGDPPESFDEVVIATHSDQALGLLTDPSGDEKAVLAAIRYEANDVVLHTDASVMPRRRRAWAAWNSHLPLDPTASVRVTYSMNILQGLRSRRPLLVTLNEGDAIDSSTVLGRWRYAHPQFTADATAAQRQRDRIDGRNRTHYCGAYWGYGFHEDGVQSALRVTERFGKTL